MTPVASHAHQYELLWKNASDLSSAELNHLTSEVLEKYESKNPHYTGAWPIAYTFLVLEKFNLNDLSQGFQSLQPPLTGVIDAIDIGELGLNTVSDAYHSLAFKAVASVVLRQTLLLTLIKNGHMMIAEQEKLSLVRAILVAMAIVYKEYPAEKAQKILRKSIESTLRREFQKLGPLTAAQQSRFQNFFETWPEAFTTQELERRSQEIKNSFFRSGLGKTYAEFLFTKKHRGYKWGSAIPLCLVGSACWYSSVGLDQTIEGTFWWALSYTLASYYLFMPTAMSAYGVLGPGLSFRLKLDTRAETLQEIARSCREALR